MLRTSIDKIRENGFELTKKRSRRYPAKTITNADYADNIALLANTRNQAETLLHSLERAVAGIGLHVKAHKTQYMCLYEASDISTLDGTSLKQVDKFSYLGSSVSSTEKDIDTRLRKTWTAIDKLKTCHRRWTIEKSGERGSGISVLAARHDDDDIIVELFFFFFFFFLFMPESI